MEGVHAALGPRLAERVQLATDGGKIYLEAIDEAFRGSVGYATPVKPYSKDEGGPEARNGPPACIGARPEAKIGNPDPDPISTSHAGRANLTVRMSMRRFTRLTNGFSKKVENHAHALAIHFMHYNFSRVHKSLRITPAMAAGVSDHVWPLEEIIGLLD